MIDLRTHLISLVAVFIALGIGILIGIDLIGGKTLIHQERAMVHRLEVDFGRLRTQNSQLSATIRQEQHVISVNDQFAGQVVPVLIGGRLVGEDIAVVTTSAAVDPTQITRALRDAGATVGPVVSLLPITTKSTAAGAQILAVSADAPTFYASLADAMASALAAGNPGSLPSLQQVGLFHQTGSFTAPVKAVLLVGGEAKGQDVLAKDFGVPFVRDLKKAGITVTEGEDMAVPESASTIPLFDTLGIATVDDLDTAPGEVAMVWGLAGATGTWGQKATAQSLMPPLEATP